MKSRLNLSLFVLFSLAVLIVPCANAAENLTDGWNAYYDPPPVSFSAVGETLTISAGNASTDVWGKWEKNFAGAIGAAATINISSVNRTSFIGLRKYIGQVASGNYIVAEINLRQYGTDRHIWYRIRERNQNHEHIRVVTFGYLGDFSGFWNTSEDVDLGLVYINGNIVFYTSKMDAYSIVRLQEPIVYFNLRSFQIEIQAMATAGAVNPAIVGTVRNVTVLYADDLGVFQALGSSGFDINEDGKTGVEEAVYALQVTSGLRTSSGYTNSNLYGTWFIMEPSGVPDGYAVFDGSGTILEIGGLFNIDIPAGSYNVSPDGSISMSINDRLSEDPIIVAGHFVSADIATLDTLTLYRLNDTTTCQGAWSGVLNEYAGSSYPISFSVNNQGIVSGFTGFAPPVYGKMFSYEGKVIAFFWTGEDFETNPYNQIRLRGLLSGNSVSDGIYGIDNGIGEDGDFTLSR